MFSARVPVKRNGSCRTTAKWWRSAVQILLAQIDAVDQNLPGGDVVEAHHQAGEGGFAGAGVADDGDRLPRLDGEGDIFENPFDAGNGGEGSGFSRLDPFGNCSRDLGCTTA